MHKNETELKAYMQLRAWEGLEQTLRTLNHDVSKLLPCTSWPACMKCIKHSSSKAGFGSNAFQLLSSGVSQRMRTLDWSFHGSVDEWLNVR